MKKKKKKKKQRRQNRKQKVFQWPTKHRFRSSSPYLQITSTIVHKRTLSAALPALARNPSRQTMTASSKPNTVTAWQVVAFARATLLCHHVPIAPGCIFPCKYRSMTLTRGYSDGRSGAALKHPPVSFRRLVSPDPGLIPYKRAPTSTTACDYLYAAAVITYNTVLYSHTKVLCTVKRHRFIGDVRPLLHIFIYFSPRDGGDPTSCCNDDPFTVSILSECS